MRLRYDTPVLIAETDRQRSGVLGAGFLALGAAFGLFAFASVASGWSEAATAGLTLLAAASVAAAALREGWARRRRRFVVDFDRHLLRLDFTTPLRGMPRTMVVPFAEVKQVDRLEQPDGFFALTVDFAYRGRVLREVLVANAAAADEAALARLERILERAFGHEGPA